MNLSVDIDRYSGFCNGVVNAIKKAERYLDTNKRLYSLGAIVHNSAEIARLERKGLEIIDIDRMKELRDDVVLVRAHGEPPTTYRMAEERGISIIDCTCPVVLKLQRDIAAKYNELKPLGGQIIIFGKRGHAEVNGLVGRTNGEAIVVEKPEDIENIDFSKPTALFSQTTKDVEEYRRLVESIKAKGCENFTFCDTICRQVASRYGHLADFAKGHDVILFVSGSDSSNGKVLFELCKNFNPRTHRVETASDIKKEWFKENEKVGICGATSTPRWQLEEIYYICKHL